MALFGNTKSNIRRRVLETVEQRVADGQREYDEVSAKLDLDLAEGIRALTMANLEGKHREEDRIVSNIIG